jgi:hypothetical protein
VAPALQHNFAYTRPGTNWRARAFFLFEEESVMDIRGDITDELSGDGMIIIDGRHVALVPYSLTLAPEGGRVIAEGSISGPEPLLRQVKKARGVKLALEDGPVLAIRCRGGHGGTRWVQALKG